MTRSHGRPKPGKGNMQEETKKKKEKNEIKLPDLKPVKDPKAGYPPDPCGPGRSPNRFVPSSK